jgi:hypothetical protein
MDNNPDMEPQHSLTCTATCVHHRRCGDALAGGLRGARMISKFLAIDAMIAEPERKLTCCNKETPPGSQEQSALAPELVRRSPFGPCTGDNLAALA